MPKLRRLSGAEVVAIFARFGFSVASQRGSHIKLKRATAEGTQTLTVPAHREIDTGTLRAIVRQAARFIPESDLRPHFYEAADQIHEPSEAERVSTRGARMVALSWDALIPAGWMQSPEAAVWVTCFHCMGLSKADLSSGCRVTDLGDVRAVILYGHLPYARIGELEIHSKGRPEFHMSTEITRTPEGAYLLLVSPFDHEDPAAELRARANADVAAGLLAAVVGRNIVYRRMFENVSYVRKASWQTSGPVIRNPASLPLPDVREARLALCAEAFRGASALKVKDRNRLLLSLRWFAQAFESDGVDGFLKYWIALEALGMSEANNVKPLKESLGRSYAIATDEAEARYCVGRIFGFRSGIMHQGLTPSIHGGLLDYIEALYRDVLFERLALTSEGAAEAIRKQPGFDLRALLGQP
jgi:predicted RNA binding protein YcfA (HicA-like mRNA interferase family)